MIDKTRHASFILRAISTCCLIVCVSTACTNVHKNHIVNNGYISNEHELIGLLSTVFSTHSEAARVYFESSCKSRSKPNLLTLGSLPLPTISIRSVSAAQSPSAAVRQIFLDNRNVSTYTNDSGLVVVEIGNVNRDILETKINSIRLSSSQRYTPQLAIDKILRHVAIQTAEGKRNLSLLPRPMDLHVVSPSPGLPHLPSQFGPVTLDQALDSVASTFHGVVIFGICTRWGVYDVRFVPHKKGLG